MFETIRTINGRKQPSDKMYWEEYTGSVDKEILVYSQMKSYAPGEIGSFANTYYKCTEYNGADFNEIRIPGLIGWETVNIYPWQI